MGYRSSFILNVILITALLLVMVAFVFRPGHLVPSDEGQVSGQSTD